MLPAEYEQHDAVGLAQLVREGRVTPTELLEAAIGQVERINPRVNAVVSKLYDHARQAIAAGLPDGPLRGVPFMLKDLYALCTGTVSSNGSRFFAGNLADHDSEMVARYKRAGLVIMGRTNTPEFGLTVTTEPRLFGPTRNPWKLDSMAGGSSGGAAAAVASGMLPAAHASDGGGSIRIPASCCGVLGLKPTRGRNPQGPDRGEGWSGMSTEHVVSRSVRDSAALLDLTCGPDRGAPYYATPPARPYLSELSAPVGRLRIGLALGTPAGEPVDAECERAARDAAGLCESLGHRIEEVRLDGIPEEFGAAFRVVIAGNIRAAIELHAARIGRQPQAGDLEGVTAAMFDAGAKASAADYARAVLTIHRTGRAVAHWFDKVDVLLSPTLSEPPQKLGVFDMNTDDFDLYGRHVARFTAFTSCFNASGNPAMSVPLHWAPDGLPIGVQFAGRYGDEATLLRLAGQLEQVRPWAGRRPALAPPASGL
jgi:Asp-tRNA(Asn)/Glu-tRNA(Gln) amidotransferase A subunit family amidase